MHAAKTFFTFLLWLLAERPISTSKPKVLLEENVAVNRAGFAGGSNS
jgi:hypothetical protein